MFGLWAVVLVAAIALRFGWATATHYVNDTVDYTEPLFVVVIMALAATRPIIALAEAALGAGRAPSAATRRRRGGSPSSRSAPLLGSLITEPAAMTIAALLLARQFYDLEPGRAPEVRDARAAVRQRLDRRHAHAFRRAAGADGGAALGLGHRVHADARSAGAPSWRSSCRTWPTS